jgi:hypothetical protein
MRPAIKWSLMEGPAWEVEILDRLADHLQLAERGVLPHLLSQERVTAGAGVPRDVTECVADVLEVDANRPSQGSSFVEDPLLQIRAEPANG